MIRSICLVASGDSRLAANRVCWPAQAALEDTLVRTFAALGASVVRAHPIDPVKGHGFLDSQIAGIEAFRRIDPDAPIVVAEAVWQYTSHVLPGLTRHRGPILTAANWSGQWPGLVGLLNLNASLTAAGIPYSTIWSETFDDEFARTAIAGWLEDGRIEHDRSHVRPFDPSLLPADLAAAATRGEALGRTLQSQQAIMGVFDEGCMGMYNAIIPDELLRRTGVFKERLSQSALYAAMCRVPDVTTRRHLAWLRDRGMTFAFGPDPAVDLTEAQVLEGLAMYEAAVRMAVEFGCATIGIQYQQGLKDTCVASDLAEGLLNNPDRPPVVDDEGRPLLDGCAVPHFNEADEGAGLDALITNRVWTDAGLDPSTTLHDVRWGGPCCGAGVNEFVWLFEISGAVPASHLAGGYAGARGERQPPMYFPHGGSTIKGVSKPGELVWSRVYIERHRLCMDIGRGGAVRLPTEETERRWAATTPQWPVMNAVLYGVSRDQFMAQHKANHIQVVYAPDAATARRLVATKAGMAMGMGLLVNLCGDIDDSLDRHQPAAHRS
jgi:L-fucose isomerase-like protein